MTDKNETVRKRWLGLQSYDEQHADVFFGRDNEAEQLFRMVKRELLTIVFAPSGTGKTSLLRAGLFPRLRKSHFMPFRLRVDHGTEGVDHMRELRKRLIKEAKKNGLQIDTVTAPQVNESEESIWEFLHRIELWNADEELVTPVILLDQFEEAFSIGEGKKETIRFLQELADLVEKRVPQNVRKRLRDAGEPLKIPTNFQRFRIIISLREDFVAQLDRLRRQSPSIMHNRYLLRALTGKQALSVVRDAGKGIVDDVVSEKIVRIVAKANRDDSVETKPLEQLEVEPNLLSLVCHELDEDRIRKNQDMLTVDGLEGASTDILRRFYRETMGQVSRETRVFVEDRMLTNSGYRKSQPLEEFQCLNIPDSDIAYLIDCHILRKIDHRDLPHIELTHDLLTGVVKESRDYRKELEENEKLKQTRKKEKQRFQIVSILSVIFLGLTALSVIAWMRSSAAQQHAEEASYQAEKSARESRELLSFMTTRLYDRLASVGRLDLMHVVAEKAKEQFEKSSSNEALFDDLEPIMGAQILNKLGNVLAQKGEIREAIKFHQLALKSIEEIQSPPEEIRLNQARMILDYAHLLAEWGMPDESLKIYDLALQRAQSKDKTAKILSIADDVEIGKARVMLTIGRIQEAESILKKKLNYLKAYTINGSQEKKSRIEIIIWENQATVHTLLSRIEANRGRFGEAISQEQEALILYNKLVDKDSGNDFWQFLKAESLMRLGEHHRQSKDFKGALDKFEPAYELAKHQIKLSATIRSLVSLKNKNQEEGTSSDGSYRWKLLSAKANNAMADVWISWLESGHPSNLKHKTMFDRADLFLENAVKQLDNISQKETLGALAEKIRILRLSARLHADELPTTSSQSSIALLEKAKNKLDELKQLHQSYKTQIDYIHVCSQIAQIKEAKGGMREPAEEFNTATQHLSNLLSRSNTLLPATEALLGEIKMMQATALTERGKIQRARDVLSDADTHHFEEALKNDPTNLIHRRQLADCVAFQAELLATDEKEKSISLYKKACNILLNDTEPTELWVNDRLSLARYTMGIGKVYLKNNDIESAMHHLKKASALGWREASEKMRNLLKKQLEEESSNRKLQRKIDYFANAAIKQERRILAMPAVFNDRVISDVIMPLKRQVYTDLLITEPYFGHHSNSRHAVNPVLSESKRIKHEYDLQLDKGILEELISRYRLVREQSTARLNLATAASSAYSGRAFIDSTKHPDSLISPNSPVPARAPSVTPTVIGDECTLTWDYIGSGEQFRRYQLTISLEPDFPTNAPEKSYTAFTNGPLHRLDFKHKELARFINHRIYWRVRLYSEEGPGPWCLPQRFDIYESLWTRMQITGELRVAVTQFAGDLLRRGDINDKDKEFEGFDGRILVAVKNILNQRLKEVSREPQASALGERNYFGKEDAKLEIKAQIYGWDDMFQAVNRNDVDIAISTITKTKEREKRLGIVFTEPYYETKLVAMAGRQLETLDDIRSMTVYANQGFRGNEIGRYIMAGIEDQLVAEIFDDISLLADRVLEPLKEGNIMPEEIRRVAITDHAFVLQYGDKETPIEGRTLRDVLQTLELDKEFYENLIEEARSEASPLHKHYAQLVEMQEDYGGLEWEQYAIAVGATDDGVLLGHLNEAILHLRRTNKIEELCEPKLKEGQKQRPGDKLPVPKRILGEHQLSEADRKLATIVPEFPPARTTNNGDTADIQTVFGENIEFKWNDLGDIRQTPHYRLQIATDINFFKSSLLVDKQGFKNSNLKVARKELIDSDGLAPARLFWRAKRIEQQAKKDLFPLDGWCIPIEFRYYLNAIERIKRTKELRIGINITNGYSFYKMDSGKYGGVDQNISKDLVKVLADRLELDEVKPTLVQMDFSDMFKALGRNDIDIAMSGITYRPEREKKHGIKFSEPYCKTRQAAIWLRSRGYNDVSQLIDKRFIVLEGTRADMIAPYFVNNPSTLIREFDNPKAYLLEKIEAGIADATIMDFPTAVKEVKDYTAQLRTNGNQALNEGIFQIGILHSDKLPLQIRNRLENELGEKPLEDLYAIPVNEQQTELLNHINATLHLLKSVKADRLAQYFNQFDTNDLQAPLFEQLK